MVSADKVRQLALALPEVLEQDHFGFPSFRVRGKVFATLRPTEGRAMLKLSIPDQSLALAALPGHAEPAAGAWGLRGCTFLALDAVPAALFRQLLHAAWAHSAPKPLARLHPFPEKTP